MKHELIFHFYDLKKKRSNEKPSLETIETFAGESCFDYRYYSIEFEITKIFLINDCENFFVFEIYYPDKYIGKIDIDHIERKMVENMAMLGESVTPFKEYLTRCN